MPKVSLYDSVGFGVIIKYNSGVIYSNQTGGTCCLHPEVEGIYSPFSNDYSVPKYEYLSPELELTEYFEREKYGGSGATTGIDEEDALFIETILLKYGVFEIITVNRKLFKKSHEAWIHVLINSDSHVFKGFEPYPRKGVLTWSNSD